MPVPKAVPIPRADQHQRADKVPGDQHRQRREGPRPGLAAETDDLDDVDCDQVAELLKNSPLSLRFCHE